MNSTWWVNPKDLDKQQKAVIELGDKGHFFIEGPPGSGKTNLLLLRAKYLYKAGQRNLAIVTMARSLKEFITFGARENKFIESTVNTFMSLGKAILLQNGIFFKSNDNYQDSSKQLIVELKNLISRRLAGNDYDCILVDEAQDFSEEELRIISQLARNTYFVADSNQRIYNNSTSNIDYLRKFAGEDHCYKLIHHYRNGIKICKFADDIISNDDHIPLADTANYREEDNPSAVVAIKNDSFERSIEDLKVRVSNQLKTYPNENIGIVVQNNEVLKRLHNALSEWEHLALCSFHEDGSIIDFSGDYRIYCLSAFSVKGLEFRAVHMFEWHWRRNLPHNRRLSYMTATRAKTSLSVYFYDNLYEYFDQAIGNLNPPGALPTIGDLFE